MGGTLPASVLVLPVMEPTMTTRLSAPSFFGSACGGRVEGSANGLAQSCGDGAALVWHNDHKEVFQQMGAQNSFAAAASAAPVEEERLHT